MGPKRNHKCPYKKEQEDQSERQCDNGSRGWSDAAMNQGMLAASRSRKRQGNDSPLEPLERHTAPQYFEAF